jgi:hypothetical protein
MSCELNDINPPSACKDATNYKCYSAKGGYIYKDGKKYGEIISRENEWIEFMVTRDNRYMNGKIRRIYLVNG